MNNKKSNNYYETLTKIKNLITCKNKFNKRTKQRPKFLSFLINEEAYHKEILKSSDNMSKIKILKNKEDEYQNNNIDKNFIILKNNKDTKISKNNFIFFRYNKSICWLDCFLFIFNWRIFKRY